MNKKIYTTPRVEVIDVTTEGMIAESLRIGSTEGREQLSNKKGWDCADWDTNSIWDDNE